MHASKWLSMPLWKLRIAAQLFQSEILMKEVWRRVTESEGLFELGARILRYAILLLFAMLSRRLCVIASIYTWFRLVDNVIDGDMPLPSETLESYLAAKNKVLRFFFTQESPESQMHREEVLLAYFVREAQGLPVFSKLCEQIQNLWELMQFDAQRREARALATRNELDNFAFKQDASILRCCVYVLNGDVKQLEVIVQALCGLFTRTDWLLDYYDDIRKGIIYIPAEVFEQHGMDLKAMQNCQSEQELLASSGLKEWRREERERLNASWLSALKVVGTNFGNVFSSAFVTKLCWIAIYRRFYQSFFSLSS
jgi:phytoene/squalene synthetase